MINIILLEDNRAQWRDYNLYLRNNFKEEINLLNQDFLPTFKEMQGFVKDNIHLTPLIIADISLDRERPSDEDRWSPQLILNVLEDQAIYNLISRRGVAIAFMTAFTKEEYNVKMRNKFTKLLNFNYIYNSDIRKGNFTQNLMQFLENFKSEFKQVTDGKWIKNGLLHHYLTDVGKIKFDYQLTGHNKVHLHQIAALELNTDGDGRIWYENEARQIVRNSFTSSKDNISNIFRLFLIKNGRDKRIRDQFEAVAETVHFIHVCDQPFRVLNARKNWLYKSRDCGHGKVFTLAGQHLEIEGTFDTYNHWFNKSENIFFNKW